MTANQEHLAVDITFTDGSESKPEIKESSRVDVSVEGRIYPTAQLASGNYIAWWFSAENPPSLDSPEVDKWVTAPTRFLAAGTLHEMWENPLALQEMKTNR